MNIAILDFDNTLYQGYSRYELGIAMEHAGMIHKGFQNEIEDLQRKYDDGQISYNEKFDQDKAIFSKYYNGVNQVETEKFLRDDFEFESLMMPWAKPAIEMLHNHDYIVVVVSGCWDFIIEFAQEILDFDTFFASSFEVKEGYITENYNRILDSKTKKVYSTELLKDAEKSVGIGDSTADLVFLEMVDTGLLYEPRTDAVNAVTSERVVLVNGMDVLEKLEGVLHS